jgi:hypothetical protein
LPTIEHSQLTDPDRHEPKGASTAVASRVYVSDGVGSGAWSQVPQAALASSAKAFEAQLFRAVDFQASGTHAGTFNAGVWTVRQLNQVTTNEIAGASLTLNQITLPAGTYWVFCTVPGYQVDGHRASFYNVTDATDYLFGTTEIAGAAEHIMTRSIIDGRFAIAAPKVFSIRHLCSTTRVTAGLGGGVSLGPELYTTVCIWKVA